MSHGSDALQTHNFKEYNTYISPPSEKPHLACFIFLRTFVSKRITLHKVTVVTF